MQIQLNVHSETPVKPAVRAEIEAMLNRRLRRFETMFTRLEVYLDRNEGPTADVEPWHCGIEARAAGTRAIRVDHAAQRPDLAAEGAAVKLVTATERRLARRRTIARRRERR